eukprot:TRINITY_DN3197_c0_g1_i3.p1 TRINITY_DN3197_c0_g1~~TRINITY_DN3197_c0_g1_i3.p1  ORF type:complete len:263 (-),score=37.26 TRINITY_DN3197_c0_g1_i3:1418-2206(-)
MPKVNAKHLLIIAAAASISLAAALWVWRRASSCDQQGGLEQAVGALCLKYPRSRVGSEAVVYSYGTAGFRTKHEVLDAPMARVGILASLLSAYSGGAAVGVMVTASHNSNKDNGVKIMDAQGEMIDNDWETFASLLANADENAVWLTIRAFAKQHLGIDSLSSAVSRLSQAKVFVGYDTRSSSVRLKNIVIEGVNCLTGQAFDHGLVTTPQLHWIVRSFNSGRSSIGEPLHFSPVSKFDSRINLDLYFHNLSQSFLELMSFG